MCNPGSNGDAIALGLAKHISSAEFKSLLFFLLLQLYL